MRQYFISYVWYSYEGAQTIGSTIISRSSPIVTHEDISAIEDCVSKQIHADAVILNWRRMEEPE